MTYQERAEQFAKHKDLPGPLDPSAISAIAQEFRNVAADTLSDVAQSAPGYKQGSNARRRWNMKAIALREGREL